MIKVIVVAVIGVLVGLGGTSGMAVMKAKKVAAAVQDSLAAHADSTDSDEQRGRPSKARDGEAKHVQTPAATEPTTATVAPADSTPVAVAHVTAPKAPLPKIAPPAAPTDTGSVVTTPPAPGRISKIFGAMSAKDAARVLEQMDDADVRTVLSGLNDRQAAAILAGFPPARAAAISKASLRQKGAS